MANLMRMDDRQFRRAKRLIRQLCANYDGGNCLPLDDGSWGPREASASWGEEEQRSERAFRRQAETSDMELATTSPCPQLITRTLICKYFRAAVLPSDRALWAEVMAGRPVKSCRVCGAPVFSPSNAAKYCPACAARERRRRDRERKRDRPRTSANRGLESLGTQGVESAGPPGEVSLSPEIEI